MPKQKQTDKQVFERISRKHPGVFKMAASNDGFEIYCKLCNCIVQARKMFSVEQHCSTNKHKLSAINFEAPEHSDKSLEYDYEVSKCFMEANIPLSKMENASVRELLTKYTEHTQPNLATLQLRVPKLYKETIKKLQTLAQNEYIWTSINYVADVDGRLIANFIFGILDENGVGREKSYLLNTLLVTDSEEVSSLSTFFIDSLTLLWPQGIKFHQVMACVTLANSNMIAALNNLKSIFPKMIHIICFAQSFHRIAELVRKRFSEVNSLISNTNIAFLMAPYHRHIFKKTCPTLSLPPNPCITRWCTWIKAAIFYADNFVDVKKVLHEFNDSESEAIMEAKQLFDNRKTRTELNSLKRDFSVLVKGTERIEQKGLSLQETMTVVENVLTEISSNENPEYIERLQNLLHKSDGYKCLLSIHKALYEKTYDPEQIYLKQLSIREIALFKYCPVTVYNAECIFPLYSQLFNSEIRMLRFESLKQNLIIYCNNLD